MKLFKTFTNIESFFDTYGVAFSLLVMYQGLFGGMVISNPPKVLKKMTSNVLFKLFTLFCVAFTATKDIELSLLSTFVFVLLLHFIRSTDEKNKAGYSFI